VRRCSSGGVVFIDLAVAQAAAAAALWAAAIVDHPDHWTTQGLALAGGLVCAGTVAWLSGRWPKQREALIGLLYVLGASAALLGARLDPHGRERMAELLAADLLWAQWPQVAALGVCAAAVALVGRRLHRDRWFLPALRWRGQRRGAGAGLVPGLCAADRPRLVGARRHDTRARALLAGIAAGLLGLASSWVLDAPSGACTALALAGFGLASSLRRPANAPT
jgi:zinc/manganese transport system permease protein